MDVDDRVTPGAASRLNTNGPIVIPSGSSGYLVVPQASNARPGHRTRAHKFRNDDGKGIWSVAGNQRDTATDWRQRLVWCC